MRWFALLLLCVFTSGARAEEAGHPLTLWRVDGSANSVYLLGSIHLLRAGDHPLPHAIDAAYADAEVLIMELDMDDLDPAGAQAAFNRAGVMTDGTTLRDLMGEEYYRAAEQAAAAIDVPLDMLASSEPWLAAMTVELMMLYRLGFNPMLGVEMTMTNRPRNRRRKSRRPTSRQPTRSRPRSRPSSRWPRPTSRAASSSSRSTAGRSTCRWSSPPPGSWSGH